MFHTIDQIKPYEHNAKLHPDWHIEKIANSIRAFGCLQPIVVDKDGILVAGHGRFKAMTEKLGFTLLKETSHAKKGEAFIPYLVAENLTDDEIKAYRLADNQLNAMTGIDMDLVLEELKELDLSGTDIELTGFDKDLILQTEEKDDEVPETPEETESKLGDVYELGNHRILCGDSTKFEDIEKLMNDKRVDMFLCDPPYNVDYEGKTKDALKIENDKKSDGDFRQFLRDAFSTVDSVLKPGAVFYIWHSDSEGYNFRGACVDNDWVVRQCLIWNKNSMVMGRQDYHWKHEPCLYGWKDGASHLWATDRKQTTILNFDRPTRSEKHPTMKPVDLLAYQICNNTKGDDIVLDTFIGSGSTLIASEKTGRICYGMELDPKYVDVIVQRYVDYTGNETVKKNGEEIRWLKKD